MAERHQLQRGSSDAYGYFAQFRFPKSVRTAANGEEEASTEADEPPDPLLRHTTNSSPSTLDSQVQTIKPTRSQSFTKSSLPHTLARRDSLLTQAFAPKADGRSEHWLATKVSADAQQALSANFLPRSNSTSTAELTSDEGHNSPGINCSSRPHTPDTLHGLPALATSGDSSATAVKIVRSDGDETDAHQQIHDASSMTSKEATVEAGLGRKRCVMFACFQKTVQGSTTRKKPDTVQPNVDQSSQQPRKNSPVESMVQARRCSVLRFACPSKPYQIMRDKAHENLQQVSTTSKHHVAARATATDSKICSNDVTPTDSFPPGIFDKSEATRFHEFGSSVEQNDDWIKQIPDTTRRLTVDGLLTKEKALRQLGQEIDDEADEENDLDEVDDGEANNVDGGDDDDDDDSNDNEDDEEEDEEEEEEEEETYLKDESDGGNESDNEEGFGESDDGSDTGSQDIFWIPGKTTAATSMDLMEGAPSHIQRSSQNSSVESLGATSKEHTARSKKRNIIPKMRPCTPELPDSTDFVCGTLDEDKPMEQAFLACLEQRKRSKQVEAGDIDPTMPTSDLDDDNDESDGGAWSEEHQWIQGQFDDEQGRLRGRKLSSRLSPPPKSKKFSPHGAQRITPLPPTPLPHFQSNRSPRHQSVRSPCGGSPSAIYSKAVEVPPTYRPYNLRQSALDQHAPLQTKSLPRRSTMLLIHHHDSIKAPPSDVPSKTAARKIQYLRGARDILQGLEKKRQRRKEKMIQQRTFRFSKEGRKVRPGQGAEKMKVVGMGLMGKNRCIGLPDQLRPQGVLSI